MSSKRAWISAVTGGALALSACSFIDDFSKFEKRAGNTPKLDAGSNLDAGGGGKHDAGPSGPSDGGSDAAVDCQSAQDGTACGMAPHFICLNGACQMSACGDGFVDRARDEECDAPDDTAGDGCEPVSCRYSCHAHADCDDGLVCNGSETCSSKHVCAQGKAADDGTACPRGPGSADGICRASLCAPSTCGNGLLDVSIEECDPSAAGTASGCLADCSWGCTSDGDCDDRDPCNGAETCANHICTTGTPLGCDDAEPCTADSCEHGVGCHNDIIDVDNDSFAPGTCAKPQLKGGDCNDEDLGMYPGAPESCDGKDNDCDGIKDDNVATFPCYPDADGDGYPSNANATSPQCKCDVGTMPARDDDQWDCYDVNNPRDPVGTRGIDYNPSVTSFFTTGYCSGKGCILGAYDFDHNCDGKAEQHWTRVNASSCESVLLGCGGDGWTGSAPPNCGAEGEFFNCSSCGTKLCLCSSSTTTQTQACR